MSNIYLFSTIGNDTRLLESWLLYYSEFNFDGIFLSLHIRNEKDDALARSVQALAASHGAVVKDYHRSPEYGQAQRLARLQASCCGPEDWFVVADVDEFIEFSDSPAFLVEACRAQGCAFVIGLFLDRLGLQGSLPSLDGLAELPLWDLFPLGCHLTRDVAKATYRKVVLASSQSTVEYGQHSASGNGLPIDRGTAIVHHFKWDELVIERTRYMLWLHAMLGEPWVLEKLRILRYLEARGTPDGDAAVSPPAAFWPRYRRSAKVGMPCEEASDARLDLSHAVLRRVRSPAAGFIRVVDAPTQGLGWIHPGALGLDAAEVVALVSENLDGFSTFGAVTERIYKALKPHGVQYLVLEEWIQEIVRKLISSEYAQIVSAG